LLAGLVFSMGLFRVFDIAEQKNYDCASGI